MNLAWLEKDDLSQSRHGRATDRASERTAWIHLMSTRLCGWCPQGPSHHVRKWARSETSEKGLCQSGEARERSLGSMSGVCKHAGFSVEVCKTSKLMVIFVLSPEMKGPWHIGLGKHPVAGPATHMGSCSMESSPLREAVLQASSFMEVLSHCWLSWCVQHFI